MLDVMVGFWMVPRMIVLVVVWVGGPQGRGASFSSGGGRQMVTSLGAGGTSCSVVGTDGHSGW